MEVLQERHRQNKHKLGERCKYKLRTPLEVALWERPSSNSKEAKLVNFDNFLAIYAEARSSRPRRFKGWQKPDRTISVQLLTITLGVQNGPEVAFVKTEGIYAVLIIGKHSLWYSCWRTVQEDYEKIFGNLCRQDFALGHMYSL